MHPQAAARIGAVIRCHATGLEQATSPEALMSGRGDSERLMDMLRDALDELEAALTLSPDDWHRTGEPSRDHWDDRMRECRPWDSNPEPWA